jgi:hypothetical protein
VDASGLWRLIEQTHVVGLALLPLRRLEAVRTFDLSHKPGASVETAF